MLLPAQGLPSSVASPAPAALPSPAQSMVPIFGIAFPSFLVHDQGSSQGDSPDVVVVEAACVEVDLQQVKPGVPVPCVDGVSTSAQPQMQHAY